MKIVEQDAEVSGLLKKRSAVKRRRVDIESELRTTGKFLYDVGTALRHVSGGGMGSRVNHILPKLDNVPAVCELGHVKAMLEELKELEVRLAELNRSASEMGID